MKRFAVVCSARPLAPGSKRTRGGSEVNPGRVGGQPGAVRGATWGGSEVNSGRMQGEPGASRFCTAYSEDQFKPRACARVPLITMGSRACVPSECLCRVGAVDAPKGVGRAVPRRCAAHRMQKIA